MKFFRFDSEYLARPFVLIAFWCSLVGGIAMIAMAALWLNGTRWEVATAAVGVFSLVDASLLRYGYEIKRTIIELHAYFSDAA